MLKPTLNNIVNNRISKKSNKRGKRKYAKKLVKSLIFTGFNPNGARSKWTTIKKLVRDTQSAVITMQETKCSQVGQINLDGYYTYEHLRSKKEGGGVALSALKELQPAFISDGGDEVEALTVDIHVKNMTISVVSAYGPQESANVDTKKAFWQYLHEEAYKARIYGKGFIIQGDLNAWLGNTVLPGDLHTQNKNGKMFELFLNQNKLICVNTLPLTQGLITRSRKLLNEVKQSTIDFYVVCERVLPHVTCMKIDNGNNHILTNYFNVNSDGKPVNSDHFPLNMEVKLESSPIIRKKVEVLNFKDRMGQIVFNEITTNTTVFTDCVKNVHNMSYGAQKWISMVKSHCNKAFKKIRIRTGKIKPSAADKMITERNRLVRMERFNESKILDVKIAKMISEEGRIKAFMFKKYTDNSSSQCLSEMWKLKKKLFPKKAHTIPSAKKDYQGKIVSEPKELTKLMGEEYGKVRLRKRPVHPMNMEGKKIRKLVLKLKLMSAKLKKTEPFKMEDLDKVLKDLKSNKARDQEGIGRLIFKNTVIGSNLKKSLLDLLNNIKDTKSIPEFMKRAIVTTIPKKGSKLLLKNERGIFIVNTVRNILMRLIFNLKHETIDSHMSDSNVGGRQNKSGINHIWVINNIIHDQLTSVKKKPVVIQQYDYQQMFDSMDASEACGDIYNYGVNDDHLKIVHEANKEIVINVKTPQGLSQDYTLTNRIMQGDTWASALASAQVDSFGKEMLLEEPNFMFKFKEEVAIPILGQVDDIIGVAEAGYKTNQLNAYINVKTADKELQFGPEK